MTEEKSQEHTTHHHEHKEHQHMEHKKSEEFVIKKSDTWKITTALAVLLLIISIATGGFGIKGGGVSAEEAAENALDFINTNMLQPGMSATLNDVEEVSGVYSIDINVAGQPYKSYVTKDGKFLFVNAVDTTQKIEMTESPETQQQTPDAVKSDKP